MPDPKQRVTEVAATELYTLTPDCGAESAARLAVDAGAGHLLVIDNGILAGIVSHRDLAKTLAKDRKIVKQIMTAPVLCIAPDTTVAEALQIMEENHVGFLPLLASGFLLGYVDEAILRGEKRAPITEIGVRSPN